MIDQLLEKNIVPDHLIRLGIRHLLKKRLKDENLGNVEQNQFKIMELIQTLKESPTAVKTDEANEQHYEVPADFFQTVLGGHLKYSCGYWDNSTSNLTEAEEKMLELTVERAGIKNGDRILELGCGWGSLTLFMAQKFPKSKITAISNSSSQRDFINNNLQKYKLNNVEIVTADINYFDTEEKFDRIVSVEMFEHVRNYETLFNKISKFLNPDGELFVHIFTHSKLSYLFEVKDSSDWMSKYFFSGGIMPSDTLLFYFSSDFAIEKHWVVNGTHYQKTSEAWLKNMDDNSESIKKLFASVYGKGNETKWFSYWRIFFMSCAELWGFNKGNEWHVSHYRFKKRSK